MKIEDMSDKLLRSYRKIAKSITARDSGISKLTFSANGESATLTEDGAKRVIANVNAELKRRKAKP